MKVLVAPLNWGLGHATRCVPIIRALQAAGATPVLASDGAALALLRREFPNLETLELPSYDIQYAKSGGWRLALKMLMQLPKIGKAIILEYFLIRKYLKNKEIQIVISDNRFGVFAPPPVYSIFLTHQIEIQTPFRFTTWLVNGVNHFLMRKFEEIWIPDFPTAPNLSGKLSHGNFPAFISKKMTYIEPLSRFTHAPVRKEFDLAVILSGVEPQRTILENKIWCQLQNMLKNSAPNFPENLENAPPPVSHDFLTHFSKILFVRGTTEPNPNFSHLNFENIEIHNILITSELEKKMASSEIVVSRSGYSSLMDYAALGISKVILIPTPGQTEQEYLADYFSAQNDCIAVAQSDIDLVRALAQVRKTKGFSQFSTSKKGVLGQKINEILTKTNY